MLRKNLYADFLKMKGHSVTLSHFLIPVIVSGLFLAYYSFSPWNENTKIIAFFEAVGAGFPVLIGIFTASIMEQEQNAGACQNLLTLRRKTAAFLSKLLLLLLLSLFSVLLTAVIYSLEFYIAPRHSNIGMGICLKAALILWLGSIPLYLWQILLAFRFGKGTSIGAGIISGLVSALMFTDLGRYVWKYLPVVWTGRLPYTYLQFIFGDAAAGDELISVMPIYFWVTAGSMVYYLFWASHWEGSRISE